MNPKVRLEVEVYRDAQGQPCTGEGQERQMHKDVSSSFNNRSSTRRQQERNSRSNNMPRVAAGVQHHSTWEHGGSSSNRKKAGAGHLKLDAEALEHNGMRAGWHDGPQQKKGAAAEKRGEQRWEIKKHGQQQGLLILCGSCSGPGAQATAAAIA